MFTSSGVSTSEAHELLNFFAVRAFFSKSWSWYHIQSINLSNKKSTGPPTGVCITPLSTSVNDWCNLCSWNQMVFVRYGDKILNSITLT